MIVNYIQSSEHNVIIIYNLHVKNFKHSNYIYYVIYDITLKILVLSNNNNNNNK